MAETSAATSQSTSISEQPDSAATRAFPGGSNGATVAPGLDNVESVRETLRRADEALKKANQPPTNGFVVPAASADHPPREFGRGNFDSSPAPDASFGGVSNVLGDTVSPTFRPSVSPQTRGSAGSLQTFSRAESQQYATANRLYGSENPERPPLVNIRQSQDGSVELVGRLYSSVGNASENHHSTSSLQQSLFSSARPSTQQPIPRQTIVTEFLSDKAREILRQSGQDLGTSTEEKLWSSLNASKRMDISSSMDFGHPVHQSLNHSGSNGVVSHLPPPGVAGYDESFVRKMEEEMQSLRRKLHEEQEARTHTAERFKTCSMNLEQALNDKAHLSKALERAAVSSGLREMEQKLEMEVEKRQSVERMLESLRGQVKASHLEVESQAASVRSMSGTLDLKDSEIRRRDDELSRLQESVRTKEEELRKKEEELRYKDSQLRDMQFLPNQVAQEAQSAAHKWQLDAEDSRKSALAMALQLKRCVSDLEEAQKQLASQEKAKAKLVQVMEELKKALAESTDLNDAAKEELEFLRARCQQLEEEKADLQFLNNDLSTMQVRGGDSVSCTPMKPGEQGEDLLTASDLKKLPDRTIEAGELESGSAVQM